MKNSRLVAFEILSRVLRENAYSNIAVDSAMKNNDVENKAFVSTLVYGVVERKLTLDYIIDRFLTSKNIKSKVRILLYIGAYQLYFMDKVPPRVALYETVELSKQVGTSRYQGLVNAVLHKIDANRIDIDALENLSIKYSCPENLINMWTKMYTRENTLKILECINDRPPVFAIPNRLYVDEEELQYELEGCNISGEIVDGAVLITSGFDLTNCKAFDDGLFYIEDLSSYRCAEALGAAAGDTVLDVCSAPGGKAFSIAQGMKNEGTVYAYDLYEHRVRLIESSAKRLGINIIQAGVNDAAEYNKDIPMADKILCDVPCSGFGSIRRKPEIRYKELDSIADLPDIQYKILSTSSAYLKNGGRMIYSTCTLNKKENEKVVNKFLESNSGFKLIEEVTIFPSANAGDGFYYAVLEKNEGH